MGLPVGWVCGCVSSSCVSEGGSGAGGGREDSFMGESVNRDELLAQVWTLPVLCGRETVVVVLCSCCGGGQLCFPVSLTAMGDGRAVCRGG